MTTRKRRDLGSVRITAAGCSHKRRARHLSMRLSSRQPCRRENLPRASVSAKPSRGLVSASRSKVSLSINIIYPLDGHYCWKTAEKKNITQHRIRTPAIIKFYQKKPFPEETPNAQGLLFKGTEVPTLSPVPALH